LTGRDLRKYKKPAAGGGKTAEWLGGKRITKRNPSLPPTWREKKRTGTPSKNHGERAGGLERVHVLRSTERGGPLDLKKEGWKGKKAPLDGIKGQGEGSPA